MYNVGFSFCMVKEIHAREAINQGYFILLSNIVHFVLFELLFKAVGLIQSSPLTESNIGRK